MAKSLKEWQAQVSEEMKDETKVEYYSKGFNRDPFRAGFLNGNLFYSPADGVIMYQREVSPTDAIINIKGVNFTLQDLMQDPKVNFPALVIGIFLTQYDVHIVRVPYSGIMSYKKLEKIQTKNTSMVPEERDITSGGVDYNDLSYLFNNERFIDTVFCPQINYKYYIVSVADYDVDVILHHYEGQKPMIQNSRFASIKFGSQVDLILPLPLPHELLVQNGFHVEAGVDALVRIKQSEEATVEKSADNIVQKVRHPTRM